MHPGLTPKQHTVLHALATGSDVTAAAAAAGIHRTTVHTWCRTLPVFRAALREAKAAYAEAIQEGLRSIGNSAIATLRGILESETASEANRLRAALAVIRAIEAANPDRQTPSARDFERFMDAAMHAGGENAAFYGAVHTDPPPSESTPRNSVCPCGSGAKYKRCCGRNAAPVLHNSSESITLAAGADSVAPQTHDFGAGGR